MKKLVTVLTLVAFLVSVPHAFGRGGNRWLTIDQKWNQIEAKQKNQSERLKAIERETGRATGALIEPASQQERAMVRGNGC